MDGPEPNGVSLGITYKLEKIPDEKFSFFARDQPLVESRSDELQYIVISEENHVLKDKKDSSVQPPSQPIGLKVGETEHDSLIVESRPEASYGIGFLKFDGDKILYRPAYIENPDEEARENHHWPSRISQAVKEKDGWILYPLDPTEFGAITPTTPIVLPKGHDTLMFTVGKDKKISYEVISGSPVEDNDLDAMIKDMHQPGN